MPKKPTNTDQSKPDVGVKKEDKPKTNVPAKKQEAPAQPKKQEAPAPAKKQEAPAPTKKQETGKPAAPVTQDKPKTTTQGKDNSSKNPPQAKDQKPKSSTAPAPKKENKPKATPAEKKEEKPVAKKEEEKKNDSDADSDSSSDSDEMPELMNAADAAGSDAGDAKGKHSRSERKAIKAMTKLGLKHVKDIVRVTIRRSKSIVFVISPAEVYKANGIDTYIIFGDAKMEDMSAQAQLAAAEKFKNLGKEKESLPTQPTIQEEDEEDENEDVDPGSLDENDINLVMTQASCSKNKAIKALKQVDGDIVNAIMNLTV